MENTDRKSMENTIGTYVPKTWLSLSVREFCFICSCLATHMFKSVCGTWVFGLEIS